MHMPHLNVRDAAKLTGKDRSTLTRAIEKGRLSAARDEAGRYLIDPAELERAFGPLLSADVLDDDRADAEHDDTRASHDAALARELELVREMLDRERTEREHERRSFDEERTFLRGMLEKQTEHVHLLTDQRERRSPSLWARLFRKRHSCVTIRM
jgi:excisionase family DNA binding protein